MSALHKCIIIQRGSALDLDEDRKDANLTNPWKWSWLEHSHKNQPLRDCIRKIQKTGYAMCVVCSKEIKYARRGRVALTEHIEKDSHMKIIEMRKKQTMLPGKLNYLFVCPVTCQLYYVYQPPSHL